MPLDETQLPVHKNCYPKSINTDEGFHEVCKLYAGILDHIIPGWRHDQSTEDTNIRVARYLQEFSQGEHNNPEKVIGPGFEDVGDHPGVVVQSNIPFRMMCEHHLLPATGKAVVAYVPNKRVVGLSKLARLVDACGVEAPSLQEHIAQRIVSVLNETIKPQGVMVVIKAEHGCMACRGVNRQGVNTTTSHVTGVFRDPKEQARLEVLQLMRND